MTQPGLGTLEDKGIGPTEQTEIFFKPKRKKKHVRRPGKNTKRRDVPGGRST